MEGGRSNKKIRVAYDIAGTPQVSPDMGEPLHDPPIERQYVYASQELEERALAVLRVSPIVDSVVDLPIGDKANRKSLPCEACQERNFDFRSSLSEIHRHPHRSMCRPKREMLRSLPPFFCVV